MKNCGAADGEADDGSEGGDQHEVGAEVEDVGEDCGDGEDESQGVDPERSADWGAEVFAETELQQESGEADGGNDDQSQRAGEGATAGVDDDQREGEEKESGSEDGPAAWRVIGVRLGSGVGQGVLSQELYSAGRRVIK